MSIPSEKISSINSVGLVKPKNLTLFKEKEFNFESGAKLNQIDVTYETYGTLNSNKDNVILICHPLTASAHAAGWHSKDDKKPGLWDPLIGPGKVIDTNQYYVICSNVLGGCYGTTGPASINPETKEEYGLNFPTVTIKDMVNLQKALMDKLKIEHLFAVIGGSMGGMQALKWTVEYPSFIEKAIPIGTSGRLKARNIAFNQLAIEAIKNDPDWQNGDYYDSEQKPINGMALARKIGIITYRTNKSFQSKFGRDRIEDKDLYSLDNQFQVNSYLDYQGEKFINRFDANSYIYLTKAMDLYDLGRGYKSFKTALSRIQAKILLITINSDKLFPPEESMELVKGLQEVGGKIKHDQINSEFGHDAFLIEFNKLYDPIRNFLQD
ncbi:homoserine O-acetyltransferase MetX [Sporohalobacter salinus]|uniref:homoserine O-acetyltransferase MetX n=1 Tax=Sporohalobacter salinus TaxID=1494606 RepID=UPI0019615EB2|nr:homoserine O-acetyltransferase [Sporohalobacter salinus]MBM7624091.1 homoserine O-acetyltransferase [Sporohalobacter salinus]